MNARRRSSAVSRNSRPPAAGFSAYKKIASAEKFLLDKRKNINYNMFRYDAYARVVELADSLDSGSSVRKDVRVQVPPRAPNQNNPNQIFLIGDGFGLFLFPGKM